MDAYKTMVSSLFPQAVETSDELLPTTQAGAEGCPTLERTGEIYYQRCAALGTKKYGEAKTKALTPAVYIDLARRVLLNPHQKLVDDHGVTKASAKHSIRQNFELLNGHVYSKAAESKAKRAASDMAPANGQEPKDDQKDKQPRYVVPWERAYQVLVWLHLEVRHGGRDAMMEGLKKAGISPHNFHKDTLKAFVAACPTCQANSKGGRKSSKEGGNVAGQATSNVARKNAGRVSKAVDKGKGKANSPGRVQLQPRASPAAPPTGLPPPPEAPSLSSSHNTTPPTPLAVYTPLDVEMGEGMGYAQEGNSGQGMGYAQEGNPGQGMGYAQKGNSEQATDYANGIDCSVGIDVPAEEAFLGHWQTISPEEMNEIMASIMPLDTEMPTTPPPPVQPTSPTNDVASSGTLEEGAPELGFSGSWPTTEGWSGYDDPDLEMIGLQDAAFDFFDNDIELPQ